MNSNVIWIAILAGGIVSSALIIVRGDLEQGAHTVGSLKQVLGRKLIGEKVFCGPFFTDPALVQDMTPSGVKVWGMTLLGHSVRELKDKSLVHVTAHLDEYLEKSLTPKTRQ